MVLVIYSIENRKETYCRKAKEDIEAEGEGVMENNKIKLLVFDLDSTLAPVGKGMEEEDLKLFRSLEKSGKRIAVASGKTCDYLCGFLRQVGLRNPIMIG